MKKTLTIKLGKKTILFALIVFLSLTFISAKLSTQIISDGGLTIEYPQIEYLKQDTPYTFHTHVVNTTSVQTDATTSCIIDIYADTGEHVLLTGFFNWNSTEYEFEYEASGSVFSNLGTHPYIIVCNNTGEQTGSVSGSFEVTETGLELTTALSGLLIGILISITLLIFFFGAVAFKLMDYEKIYPIGLFFLLISIIMAVYGLYLGVIYSNNYLYSSISAPQSRLFTGILYGLIGMMFIGLLWLIITAVKEIKERKSMQKQGEGYNAKTKRYEY